MKRSKRARASGVQAEVGPPAWLEKATAQAGRAWSQRTRAVLLRERRLPAGGWPGTLTEARAIALDCLSKTFATANTAASLEELELAARLVNASARDHWLVCAVKEPRETSPGNHDR